MLIYYYRVVKNMTVYIGDTCFWSNVVDTVILKEIRSPDNRLITPSRVAGEIKGNAVYLSPSFRNFLISPEMVDTRYEGTRPLHGEDLSRADTQILRIAQEEIRRGPVYVLTDDRALKNTIYANVPGVVVVESNIF